MDFWLYDYQHLIPKLIYTVRLLTIFQLRIYCFSRPNDKQKHQFQAAIAKPQQWSVAYPASKRFLFFLAKAENPERMLFYNLIPQSNASNIFEFSL